MIEGAKNMQQLTAQQQQQQQQQPHQAMASELRADEIYDVPPSKSLINLNFASAVDDQSTINLQRPHHMPNNSSNNDPTYLHAISSPNINHLFLNVDESDDAIYDTPSARSLAAV